MDRKGSEVHDQEVGSILAFNPSDCSHWKRGEKNIRSVFSLAKLAKELRVEQTLIHDLASGAIQLEEAYYEFTESKKFNEVQSADQMSEETFAARKRVLAFVDALHRQADF